MRALLVPATATDRDIARRLWSRLDIAMGFPRTHDAADTDVSGAATSPRTESAFYAMRRPSDGVVALVVDDPPAGLLRRRIERNGTVRTLGEWIALLRANRGWQLVTELAANDGWVLLTPRDGEAGSPDGRPVPESEDP